MRGVRGQAQVGAPGMAGDAGGMVAQGDGLAPGGQFQREHDDRQPDPVGVEAAEREVAQPGVLGGADAVLAAGAAAVP